MGSAKTGCFGVFSFSQGHGGDGAALYAAPTLLEERRGAGRISFFGDVLLFFFLRVHDFFPVVFFFSISFLVISGFGSSSWCCELSVMFIPLALPR